MDIVDRDLEKAERDASPDRFPAPGAKEHERIPRPGSASSSSSSTGSSSAASVVRQEIGMSRVNTQRDLERHPTELSRLHTQRSQHQGTVGGTLRSRESRKPLPEFGGGKPYPPLLPEQEEYVVEFDGHDDPLHPQNWPLRKKSVHFNPVMNVQANLFSQSLPGSHPRIHNFSLGLHEQHLLCSDWSCGSRVRCVD